MKSVKAPNQTAGKRAIKWGISVAGLLLVAWVVYWWFTPARTVSKTATMLVAWRAVAAQDPDPKTRNPDYLAGEIDKFIGITKRAGLNLDFDQAVKVINKGKKWIFYYATARTKHLDQVLKRAAEQGVSQAVLLGAGFDTRAYRFHKEFPEVRFFEVDLPDMVEAKKRLVQQAMKIKTPMVAWVPMDFNTQDLGRELAKAGYKADQKSVFLWEGVSMYLNAAAVEATLQFVAKNSAPGSVMVFDYLLPEVVGGTSKDEFARNLAAGLKKLGEPFTFGIAPDKLEGFLTRMGLKLESNVGHDYLVQHYMTSSAGKPVGVMPDFFWLATASVP